MNLNRRQFLKNTLKTGAAGFLISNDFLTVRLLERHSNLFPELKKYGDRFNFTLTADPQLGTTVGIGSVGGTSAVKYTDMIEEMNNMSPRPAFMIVDGDLVNVPTSQDSWDNFVNITQQSKTLPILIYGNHDGNNDTGGYAKFEDIQNTINSTSEYMFSFDCGKWHFVTIPCDIRGNIGIDHEDDVVRWLDADLKQNRGKPVMLFEHEHLMPQGLSQLEWYSYRKPLRNKLLDTISKYGNVKYVVCGHVHNGIQTSVKTAWTWKGINFITSPTCTASRQFGEEYDEYIDGLPKENGDTGGGYYMIFEVEGEEVEIKAKLTNTDHKYTYDKKFKEYDHVFLWRDNLRDLTPNSSLVNGSFENGMDGWSMEHRYVMDEDPMFYWKVSSEKSYDGGKALYLRTHEAGQIWANPELLQVHQWLTSPNNPVIDMKYLVDTEPTGSGGYMRVCAFSGEYMSQLFMVDWSGTAAEKAECLIMPQNTMYEVDTFNGVPGTRGSATALIDLGEYDNKAMYWTLPYTPFDNWNVVRLNLRQAYDDMFGSGAWNSLGIDKIYLTLGQWTLYAEGSRGSSWFDGVVLREEQSGDVTSINGSALAIDSDVFYTDFGRSKV